MNKTDAEIAEMIKTKRKSMNLKLRQVAEKANIALRHYQRFEEGSRSLATASFNTTMSVLFALDIDPDNFVETYIKTYKKRNDKI
jgi:transcriptional regulator with XRE-family HTH domain